MPESPQRGEKVFRGVPVSAGVCRGKVLILGQSRTEIPQRTLHEDEVAQEIQRLEQALIQTRLDILEVQRKVREGMGAADASIFEAHLLVLEDPTLLDEVTRKIQEQRTNVEWAFHAVSEKYAAALEAVNDEYLRERGTDLRDVSSRILNHLLGRADENVLPKFKEPCIIISHDLSPSITAQLDKKLVLGFGTDLGSRTSHTAIMACSMKIPAVVGLHNASQSLHTGDHALLDGFTGFVIINPTDQTLFEYGQLEQRQVDLEEHLREVREEPAVTLDGARVVLSANLEQPEDAEMVRTSGAEGVGLFRTEYLYINRDTLPSEQVQYEAYRKVASALKPAPVVIRTVDLGGDKFLSHLHLPQEMNPFLGWRAIRFCLQERDIFRAQLRAILRASVEGNLKMMYPMISSLEELIQANELVEECKAELRAENLPFDEQMEIGIMVEIPSAVLAADALAKRVKFFSLGTNDLIQYTLAVDRMNDRISHLYTPTHPAILRLIKATVDAARGHGIWVGVCGEMAGDPALVPLLLGLGVDELSAAVPLVPRVKFLIRRLKLEDARQLAEFALSCESSAEILARSQAMAQAIAPSLFIT